MKSIFRYPGGKSKVANRFLKVAPSFFDEYREPFVGGGSIFFAMPKIEKRWINDIDENLMSVYFALRDNSEYFIARCRMIKPPEKGEPLTSTKPGGKKIYNARLKSVFDILAINKNADPALRYFFINRTVWGGRVNYDIKSRLYYSNPTGWNIVKSFTLEKAARHVKDVKITSVDYSKLLSAPGKNVFIYLDPPYKVNSDLARNSKLYKNNFTKKDHERLAKEVKKCKHKICMSYDDDEDGFIRSLYKDSMFNIYEEYWTYCGTSSAKTHSKTKKTGKELVITNYASDKLKLLPMDFSPA